MKCIWSADFFFMSELIMPLKGIGPETWRTYYALFVDDGCVDRCTSFRLAVTSDNSELSIAEVYGQWVDGRKNDPTPYRSLRYLCLHRGCLKWRGHLHGLREKQSKNIHPSIHIHPYPSISVQTIISIFLDEKKKSLRFFSWWKNKRILNRWSSVVIHGIGKGCKFRRFRHIYAICCLVCISKSACNTSVYFQDSSLAPQDLWQSSSEMIWMSDKVQCRTVAQC